MARFYVYDLSRQCGFISKEWMIPEDGLYECFDLKPYFEDPTHRAYLIQVEQELAGFALLNPIGSCVETEWKMDEFFILAKFQGKGVGSHVATALFDKHPGRWEVTVIPENQTALSFWRKTISHYMQEQYQCETKHIRPGQSQPCRVVFTFDTRLKIQSLPENTTGSSHTNEIYCFSVGPEGHKNLSLLDKTFNEQTHYFLKKYGCRSGLSVLDIGCGSGLMTHFLAETLGETGKIVAIDNQENQINAAKQACPSHLQSMIDWRVGNIYELDRLNETFDLIYCRFVLHHVHRPRFALSQIAKVLKPGGIYIGIEGIVNAAFSIPSHPAWQSQQHPLDVVEGERNANIGLILPALIRETDMICTEAAIYQPYLLTPELRQQLLVSEYLDGKAYQIEHLQITESLWQKQYEALKSCVEDESILLGFFAANFTASRKR
jgi:predicted acetyltransferase